MHSRSISMTPSGELLLIRLKRLIFVLWHTPQETFLQTVSCFQLSVVHRSHVSYMN